MKNHKYGCKTKQKTLKLKDVLNGKVGESPQNVEQSGMMTTQEGKVSGGEGPVRAACQPGTGRAPDEN